MKRALLSVSDKTGIVDFAKDLERLGVEIISTGGTCKALRNAGVKALDVESITNFPECLDGRVKTLHPMVHGGILAVRENEDHMKHLEKFNIGLIDIVAVNLYPFKETIAKEGVLLEEAIENIDIGGPSMVRAAAKNYKYVTVITDPSDYPKIIEELEKDGDTCPHSRFYLSAKAFMHTAHYDAMISNYLKPLAGVEEFPETLTLTYEKAQDMRYGENPQQKAAFYKETGNIEGTIAGAEKLHGKELSFNNINDANGALMLLKEFTEPAVVACKHSAPCGVALGSSIHEAYLKAYESDSVSIFGGIVAFNREIDEKTAEEINKIFLEIIIAPDFSEKALEILKSKKNIRLLKINNIGNNKNNSYDIKKVAGGLLIQESDVSLYNEEDFKCVTKAKPSEKEMKDLIFAMQVVKHAKSNAIAICRNLQSVGIGNGQVSRIWACKQAIDHGKEFFENGAEGAVLASDAYFPFSDCVEQAHKAGIKAIIQPGGSIRDEESVKLCDEYGISMIFTGMRHFKH
ncbi:MAG: bifunctional phosphoribosylaminoimidazolecarboxamide formyltransferase/IMP cyclohydrolase [Lachnospiraceae bacterium]|nr:bifunctional phosphoribosylaminoimidazolecarboxamide formyltransferase/IMP cyclohydrolase [Lachnospiraceae bacterium]